MHTAPSGSPQSLQITSIGIFSASIQWERVECVQRNGNIYGYRASYFPSADSNEVRGAVLVGTDKDSRSMTITGLQPRTSYTFAVMAINLLRLSFSPAATISFLTPVPDSKLVQLSACTFILS